MTFYPVGRPLVQRFKRQARQKAGIIIISYPDLKKKGWCGFYSIGKSVLSLIGRML